ncbi:MAG: hypothetical protein IPJ77_04955 [Planctomycetes bacterium]|nr:hypothetical protein [Planctomycetota bacterium]
MRRVLLSLGLVVASVARGQSVFTEVEPNETKATATPVVCLAAGDTITGSSQGSSTGIPGPASADTFRVRTCALAPGPWRHALTLTTAIDAYRGSIRGRSQSGTPGSGGVPGTLDVELQSTPFAAPRMNAWYGFGAEEELYWRVTGSTTTTAPYVATFTSTSVAPTQLGPFAPGTITITSVNQGHGTDTDLWLFDAQGRALPGYGNDDEWPLGTLQSRLVRPFTPGTYFLAVARYNLANAEPAPSDDGFPAGPLADFPGVVVQGVQPTLPSTNASFAVTDALGTVPVSVTLNTNGQTDEIAWFRFDVGVPPVFAPNCAGDGLDPQVATPCPCGNFGGPGRGCANSAQPSGAVLVASGATNPDTVVLSVSGTPAVVSNIFLQGDAVTSTVFGDGVRCAGGSLIRLSSKVGAAGACTYPVAGEPSVSSRGGCVPGSGVRRWYQVYYRNAASGFCPPATFNVSNGWVVDW